MQKHVLSYQQYVQQVKQKITELTPESYQDSNKQYPILIDLREPSEHQSGILPGAELIPRGMLEAKLSDMPICKDKPQPLEWLSGQNIVLYCQSDSRSALAAHSLQQMGLSQVYSLAGGFAQWQKLGLPVTTKIT